MIRGREVAAVARLELGDVLRSRWLAFAGVVYALLAAVFVLVGVRESMLFGFTGMGRVLFSFCHALVLLLPLLALTATGQVVNRAREDGTLELLFSHPVGRPAYFLAVALVRYLVLALPLVAAMVLMALAGRLAFRQAMPWPFLVRASLVSASLILAFVGVGLLISTVVRNPARALMYLLLVWAAAVALIDVGLIGLMLQWRLPPQALFVIAAANPVQSARMALLSGADTELGVLGPVGFFLANRVGDGALYALGVAWPALLGLGCLGVALQRFRRGDLV